MAVPILLKFGTPIQYKMTTLKLAKFNFRHNGQQYHNSILYDID